MVLLGVDFLQVLYHLLQAIVVPFVQILFTSTVSHRLSVETVLHSMPVETTIASTSTILVLEAIVETKADDSGRGVRSSEISEKLCLDYKKLLLRPGSSRVARLIWSPKNQGQEEKKREKHLTKIFDPGSIVWPRYSDSS